MTPLDVHRKVAAVERVVIRWLRLLPKFPRLAVGVIVPMTGEWAVFSNRGGDNEFTMWLDRVSRGVDATGRRCGGEGL